jgi:hypothetical protein
MFLCKFYLSKDIFLMFMVKGANGEWLVLKLSEKFSLICEECRVPHSCEMVFFSAVSNLIHNLYIPSQPSMPQYWRALLLTENLEDLKIFDSHSFHAH